MSILDQGAGHVAAPPPAPPTGEVIDSASPEYEAARTGWNLAARRRPAYVIRCRSVEDVVAAVDYAREQGVPLAVRSGGHSVPALGPLEGGLLVDVAPLNAIAVDAEQRVASIGPGQNSASVAGRLQPHGLAIAGGDTGSVGVGGLTLGGGIGFLVRKYGLTIDQLRAVDVVAADGQVITASATSHPDLFWALRGGGGNFGVATRFEFDLLALGPIFGGAILFPPRPEILLAYVAAAAAAPEELTTIGMLMLAPPLPFIPAVAHGRPVFVVLACYAGDPEAGPPALAGLQAIGPALGAMLAPMPYPALFQLTAAGAARGWHSIRARFLDALTPELSTALVDHLVDSTQPGMIQIRVLGGALARVPAGATAFAHRTHPLLLSLLNSGLPDCSPEEATARREWTVRGLDLLAGMARRAYVNFLDDEGADGIAAAYPPAHYARLAAVKRIYDPANLFRSNPNIPPA